MGGIYAPSRYARINAHHLDTLGYTSHLNNLATLGYTRHLDTLGYTRHLRMNVETINLGNINDGKRTETQLYLLLSKRRRK